MYLHGSFGTRNEECVTVMIVTDGDMSVVKEIGDGVCGVYFGEDPVEITSEVNDTFDVLLRRSATVRLLTENFIGELFCKSCRDVVVNIVRDGVCLFAGYVEPMTYSQGYNEVLDEVELNCVDVLTALQYSRYKNVGSAGVSYSGVKNGAGSVTMAALLREILEGALAATDIVGGHAVRMLYDGSKSMDSSVSGRYGVLAAMSVNELLFMGDEADDVWQQDAVLEEVLKYLNLHIVQEGWDLYVYSWETVKGDGEICWKDLWGGGTVTTERTVTDIARGLVMGADTEISIGECYNQLLLTCEVKTMDSVVESPLDEDGMVNGYATKQKYATEYISEGKGDSAYAAMKAMVHGEATDYDGGRETDWYVQVMNALLWKFPVDGGSSDYMSLYVDGKTHQEGLPNALRSNPGCAVLKLGKVSRLKNADDNSPVSTVEMTSYMVVSVNGNGIDHDEEKTYPGVADIKGHIPYAVYRGDTSGGVFSPSDADTTNYIVISGSLILNPLTVVTDTYKALHDSEWPVEGVIPKWYGETVPSRNSEDGRYYAVEWWKADTPKSDAVWDEETLNGLMPYTGEAEEQYEFKYSAVGDSTDTISKVGLLACMLVIGGKCVVETGSTGTPSDFVWVTYKERSECASDDEYYGQCFTIGINPKIGDKLIGTEHELQNNIDYTMGIDADGTAIPIRMSDGVSGAVKFMILGPVNATWGDVTRRHPTFFRHTSWGENAVSLLAHVSSMMIKSFEMKVYSDNGLNGGDDGNDLVYMSDTVESYVNRKDDLTMKVNSALTTAECQEIGVSDTLKMSSPTVVATNLGVLSVHDWNSGENGKPEQLYVDSYYKEYHEPRVMMVQKIDEGAMVAGGDGSVKGVSLWGKWRHPMLGNVMYVQGVSRNLKDGWAEVTLKECD